jgi:hypothetical protein
MSKMPDKPDQDSFEVGDLVFITPAGHEWISRSQKMPGINLSGRTAQIVDIYDWESERGKDILAKREETGKWMGLDSESFKYIVLVFYPELEYEDKQGIMHPEMLCQKHPRMDGNPPLFSKYPDHLLEYIKGDKTLDLGK